MYTIQQSTSGTDITFLMVLSSDHVTPATGLSPTVTIRKNQGSFGSPAGTVSEIAKGWYKISGTGLATDTNTLGPLILNASGASCDFTDDRYHIVAYDPRDSTRLGLTQIPTGTIVTAGTGTNQINVIGGSVTIQSGTSSGQLDSTSGVVKSNTVQITGVAVNTTLAQIGVNIVNIKGTASAGAAGYIGLDWSQVNSPGSTVALTGTTIGTVTTVVTTSLIGISGITPSSYYSPNVTGVATNYIDKQDQLWRRFFKKSERTPTQIITYADNGTTPLTSQTYTSSSTETVGAAS